MEMKHCSRTHRQGEWLSIDIDPPRVPMIPLATSATHCVPIFFKEVGASGAPSGCENNTNFLFITFS